MPTINPATTVQPTALALMQSVLGELGLTVPTSITVNDKTVAQTLRLMNAAGKELTKLADWVWLIRSATITSVASQTAYDRPQGWLREIPDTWFNRTQKWPLRAPVSPVEWEWLQAGYGLSPPYYRARPTPGQIELFPTPPDSSTVIAYEYISAYWVLGISGGVNNVDKLAITLDTDIPVYDERVLVTFTKLKLWATKGFDVTVLAGEFQTALDYAKGQDRGARTYDLLNPMEDQILIGPYNFPNTIST